MAAEQKRGDGDGDDVAFVTPPSRVVAAPPLPAATRRLFFKLCVRPGTGHVAIIRETVPIDATWASIFEKMKLCYPSRVGDLNTVSVHFLVLET
jgi:hypothetical protein